MYNLLIVDDERIIADGLQEAVRASYLPLKNVDVVYQASKALERMESIPYDIILTDVRMPGMDGFSLVQEAKKIWPRIKAIILTGNRNFDYVRDAMRLGCVDFLIKPASDDALKDALWRVIGRLDQEWMENFSVGENEKIQSIAMKNKSKEEILKDGMFMLQEEGSVEGVKNFLKKQEFSFAFGLNMDVFLLCFRKHRMHIEEIKKGIQKILTTMYGEKVFVQVCFWNSQQMLFMIQYKKIGQGIRESLYKTWEEIQSILYEKQDVRMSITIQKNVDLDHWIEDVLRLYQRKENGFVCGELVIIDGQEWEERTGIEGIMQKIEFYIKKNPEKDLSLACLGKLFCFNPSYLSRAFHQYKNESLSAYIARIRIERAKKLLLETDEKIYEIAMKSGFETPAYFSRIFNKYEKMSPKEYRLAYRNREI